VRRSVFASKCDSVTEDVVVCMYRRPTAVQDRPVDSDEDDFRDRDYDISTMANNINREVYRYGMFDNDDAEEVRGSWAWRIVACSHGEVAFVSGMFVRMLHVYSGAEVLVAKQLIRARVRCGT
jgi:hypothetical protein